MAGLKKILIVEDYTDIATLYSFLLKKENYSVEIARNGNEALAKVLSFEPDMVLLDIMIPDMDGIEVLKNIRNNPTYKQVQPLVLVTTNVLQESISEQAAKYGADGYLIKANTDNKELMTTIEEMLSQRDRGLPYS